jgi:hypothetical protein
LKLTERERSVRKGETEVMLRDEPPGSRIRASRAKPRCTRPCDAARFHNRRHRRLAPELTQLREIPGVGDRKLEDGDELGRTGEC